MFGLDKGFLIGHKKWEKYVTFTLYLLFIMRNDKELNEPK